MYIKKELKIKQIIIAACLVLFPTIIFAATTGNTPRPTQDISSRRVPTFTVPEKLNFCGYSLPLKERHCREMLDRELTIAVYNRAQVIMWLKRAPRYFPLFTKKIKALRLPEDLKFVAVAESSLIDNIHSRAGAAGLWQFMPHTGRRRGLRITSTIDERLDPVTATEHALNYLKFLKDKFKSWPLALAAYNCGEKRVTDAVNEQKTENYHTLSLPEESERYIYRLAAIKLILKHPEAYGYQLDRDRCYTPLNLDHITLNLKNEASLVDFALRLGLTYHHVKELNPHLISNRLPAGKFNLILPAGSGRKAAGISKHLPRLPARQKAFYVVKKGDTLGAISRRFHTSSARLIRLNRLQGSKILIGQKLRLR
jgi:hypothetical protein